jgi:hypothetical protein
MSDKRIISFIEGKCTCGTPYKVYVIPVSVVMKMVTPDKLKKDKDFNHSMVFYCEGCHRDKTINYTNLDIKREEIPAGDSGQ